jgi:hypothetical protein
MLRGGTTLLQRILNSVRGVAIWGEQGDFLKKTAEAYFTTFENNATYGQLRKSEGAYSIILRQTIKCPKVWSAWKNWYGIYKYKENFRKFIKSFYSPFLYGAKHWGFKEIRYDTNDRVLEFLKHIYPKATFIFITRCPIDVISSQMTFETSRSLDKKSILKEKAENWNRKNKSFFNHYIDNKEKSYIIRYEDLILENSIELKKLFAFLNFKFTSKQKKIMKLKEGRGATKNKVNLSSEDTKFIMEQTQNVRKFFGYA